MKLAFNNKAHYTDFSDGYKMYISRSRSDRNIDVKTYNRIIRKYCSILAGRLLECGIVDLPADIGMIAAAELKRKSQYRGKTFIGYGRYDWSKGHYDGSFKTFGIVFLPKAGKRRNNLRCYGFVSNRALFKRMKEKYEHEFCQWSPIEFNDELI